MCKNSEIERNDEQPLLERLEAYGRTDVYPFHMPGHKRRLGPKEMGHLYEMDITEIDGFDNLHQPEGILKELQERAAGLGRDSVYCQWQHSGASCSDCRNMPGWRRNPCSKELS